MPTTVPQAVQSCHELLLWLIPRLDKALRARRFTLGERIERRSSGFQEKSPFTRFDELTADFDRPVPSLSKGSGRMDSDTDFWDITLEARGISR